MRVIPGTRLLASLVCCLVFASLPLLAAAALPGTVPAAVSPAGVRDLGRAPSQLAVTVALTLRYRHEAELDALLAAQQDVRGPLFRRFLTNEQFNRYFAPSATAYQRVVRSLRRAGFGVRTYPNRTVVDALAAPATVERYFGTEIHAAQQVGYGRRYLNVRPATVPADVREMVTAVVGLDDLMKAHFFVERAHPAARSDRRTALHGSLRGPDGGFGPLSIARGFVFPVQYNFDGQGRSVANVAGNVSDSDIAAYLDYFQIARTGGTTRTIVQGNGDTNPSDPAVEEATLDFETIGSLAPGANFDLYILEDPIDQPGEDAYNDIVSANVDDVVNSPFGVCEQTDRAYVSAADQIIKQGSAKGITFEAASGDGGSGACNPSGVGQYAPAVIPLVTAVGGTSYDAMPNGKYQSETGWSDSSGGVSSIYALPNYQIGLAGEASTKHRNLPDIAFPADPYTGTSYYLGGWSGPIGGTSWAVSEFTALQVEVDGRRRTRFGSVNIAIYGVFEAGDEDFHDITVGSNGKYTCGPGYDNVTGLGSIIGEPFSQVE